MIQDNILGFDHVAMQLPNLAEGLDFFHGLLGFKIKFQVEFGGQSIVMLKAGKIEIEMWESQTETALSQEASINGVHHLAVQVKHLDDIMAHIKEIGVEILADVYEPTQGIREAIVQGPGGVRLQFVEQNIPLLIWRTIKGDFRER
jgi:catechol 2,3-dioxygenase-like lactoylglutathione lyase family enzyme